MYRLGRVRRKSAETEGEQQQIAAEAPTSAANLYITLVPIEDDTVQGWPSAETEAAEIVLPVSGDVEVSEGATAVAKDAAYYDEVRRAVGRGAPVMLLGTSTRSLKRAVEGLEAARRTNGPMFDPVPDPNDLKRISKSNKLDRPSQGTRKRDEQVTLKEAQRRAEATRTAEEARLLTAEASRISGIVDIAVRAQAAHGYRTVQVQVSQGEQSASDAAAMDMVAAELESMGYSVEKWSRAGSSPNDEREYGITLEW